MKKVTIILVACLCCVLFLNMNANAQSEQPYTDGPIWMLDKIQTKPGMGDAYLKNISENWIKLYRAAKDQGIVMNYMILSSHANNPADWNLLLMVEVKDFAALDGIDKKFEALSKQVFGSSDAGDKITVSLNDMRQQMGDKLARELIFK